MLPPELFCARTADGNHARDAFGNRGQDSELGVWFGLIPKRRREVAVGPVVGVAMLDAHFDRFFEGDRVFQMPAVQTIAATDALGIRNEWRAVVTVRERRRSEIPSAVVVVLRSSAVDAGPILAVDKNHLIAFAKPAVLVLQHAMRDTHEVTASLGFEKHIVALAGQILLVVNGRLIRSEEHTS